MEWLAWLCSVPEGLGEDSSSVSSLSKGTSSLLPPSTGSESSSDEPEMEMCRHGCGPASSGCAGIGSEEGLPTGSARSLPRQGEGGKKQLQHRPVPAGFAVPVGMSYLYARLRPGTEAMQRILAEQTAMHASTVGSLRMLSKQTCPT